ncbi:oligopeptide transporter, OPT family [Asticcacaulis sp. BYS171W]|uniref:Oligopeptide transporter, OPT family n=1 Tax=Asticcacaulis aquaticus TaxID=2984212 RepID=A0ABT5HPS4_9CAUL|nr:oligopeptide transporter, OPT family [Asticcacaulis aquaticus]MDC7682062.1 oligopeptide transporter, OPT family [Asticcacaulis aquaticus]
MRSSSAPTTETPAKPMAEITVRGVLLGIVITLVFTAAQVYLGLQVGLTFATSIPAAVISMALLSAFKSATIQENNIVQTIASAAGTLASVIFVLPGLIIIGWWRDVPFFITFMACAIGGILGVMYTIPLRRALVSNSPLPYPEGVAAAEVLKVGTNTREGAREGKVGLIAVILGSLASAAYSALAAAKVLAGELAAFFKINLGGKAAATGLAGESSLALLGAGHLMGITVGIAMLVGLSIAWGVAVPVLTSLTPMPDASAADHAGAIWSTKVRYLGAGAIGAAAIWTIGKLLVPVWSGLMSALEANRKRKAGEGDLPREEQDIPIVLVGLISVLLLVPAGFMMAQFLSGTAIASLSVPLVALGVLYLAVAGLLAAAVCGYMAGLIGSSNSPVSGVGILSVLGAALLIGAVGHSVTGPDAGQALTAFALFATTFVLAVAVVGNDNLQDLKTGQLVGATPWKQQVALVIGVIAGAVVIPLVLNLLNNAFGFAGDPNYRAITGEPLGAPQATLISTLAKGAIGGNLPWDLLGTGAVIGAALVAFDIVLRKVSNQRYSLPPLGVGLAIYLPSSVTAPVVVGAFAGWIYDRTVRDKPWGEAASRLGVLIASGFIVGESLFKVMLAGVITFTGSKAPLAVFGIPYGEGTAMVIALILAASGVIGLYGWCRRAAKNI